MAAKKTNGAVSVAEIDASLPRRFFVMRGEIARAFGLAREELSVLVRNGVFVAEYPLGRNRRRARFVRTQVLAVARKWEANK